MALVNKRNKDLSIGRQSELLELPRSSYYYKPAQETEQTMTLMEFILGLKDKLMKINTKLILGIAIVTAILGIFFKNYIPLNWYRPIGLIGIIAGLSLILVAATKKNS